MIEMADRKIAIVTDSTCDLPDSVLQENHIHVVPIRIIYETREYRDRLDITAEKVFEHMAQEVPKSSLPLPQDVLDMLDGLMAAGYMDIVYLSISAGLSGSYNLVKLLVQQYTGFNIEVVDTRTVSMGLGFLVLEAAREAARSGDIKAVVAKVQRIRARMDAVFVIRTLEYLAKGGRLGRVEAAFGTLLDVKPVIEFGQDGVCHTIARARGFKNSVQKMTEMIRRRYAGKKINVAVMHAAAAVDAGTLLDEVKKFATVCESYVSQIGPALGVYSGPGLLGIVAYEAETQAQLY
jgi:DegV family protein with EDD domain